MKPTLYIVATPIGNLSDITYRAVEVLKNADLIAAEDTRVAKKLLNHLQINQVEVISYYDQVEEVRSQYLLERIQKENLSLALISDAGTPCISDPGYKIVAKAKSMGIDVHPIPGASSIITLISAAGLPCDRFMFVGFLPTKNSAIQNEIESWRIKETPIVFLESTKRLLKTLLVIDQVYPHAIVSMGRELTKMFEEILTLPIGELIQNLEKRSALKGEVVVMIDLNLQSKESAQEIEQDLKTQIQNELKNGLTNKDLVELFKDRGMKKKELYQFILELQKD